MTTEKMTATLADLKGNYTQITNALEGLAKQKAEIEKKINQLLINKVAIESAIRLTNAFIEEDKVDAAKQLQAEAEAEIADTLDTLESENIVKFPSKED